ncbi:hypothetical protein KEJ34_05565 [Candidatus Bathyarchaeota archaeon]|nr:hypothetical protein [Candidatus Bathyarchaeota archaeon]
MFSVRGLVERLRLFERNRVSLGFKVLGLAMYFQVSSLRRTARVLSEFLRHLFGSELLSLGRS